MLRRGMLVLVMLSISLPSAMAADKVALPKGYRSWAKSSQKLVDDPKSLFHGVHYIYANKTALPVYRSGGTYPQGSQFVVDYYAIRAQAGKPVQGKLNMIVLMSKDRRRSTTGGWLFAGFGPDGRPSGLDPVKHCYECHNKEAATRDLVISRFADFK